MNHREGRAATREPSPTNPDGSGADTAAALCEAGLAHMAAGRFLDAQVCCTRALAIDSGYADAFHLLGLVHAANGELDTAVELVVRAIEIDQTVADYFSNLAVLMQRQNRFDEAFKSYDLALKLKPDFIAVWLNLADLLRTQKRFDEALQTYDHVLRLDARSVEAANRSGLLLLELNRHQEALARFELLLGMSPDRADVWHRMGICLKHLNRPEEAASSFRKSLAIVQNHEVHNDLGGVLIDMRKPEDALPHFREALGIKPDFVGAINNSGIALLDLRHFEEALAMFDRAFSMSPGLAEALSNRAAALKALRRHDDALAFHDRAIALRPDYAPVHDSRASCLLDMMRLDEAFLGFQDALALQPDFAQAHVNLGLANLLAGNFKTGWIEKEWRWKSPALLSDDRKFSQPIWLGDAPIDGKVVLLHGEQGLGDTLQFCRYVPLVAARGARVVLEVQRPLRELLTGLSGASQVIARGESLPEFDFHCPLGSLPLAFDTTLDTIPSAVPYLPRNDGAQIWKDRLGAAKSPRVGLVWSGNPRHINDLNRSIPLETLLPLLDVEAQFVSLQKDVRAEDRAALGAQGNLLDLGPKLASFADTAAIVENLDLVISVDTSVAHLAGALGRPIWVLLPYVPDWRWLLNRTDSPWYPTARLFRQTEARDWQTVVREVRSALQALCQSSTGHQPLMNQREGRAGAGGPSTNPDRPTADTAAALYQTGIADLRAERYLDAQVHCERALALDSGHADSLHLMGLLSLHAAQYDHAVEWTSRAIAQDPRAEFLFSLGTALRHQRRFQEAVNVFDKAVQLKPDKAELWTALGRALVDLERRDEALLSFQHAQKLNPQLWDAAHESGTLLNRMGRREEALAHFMRCAELKPNHAADDATAFNNVGNTLQSLGRSQEALQWLDRALERRPGFVEALSNKAIALGQLRRFDEAFAAYAGVKALDPDHAVSNWNAALLHMLTGDFEAGWAGREARWQIPSLSVAYPKFTEPMWLGQANIKGKTVLISADEGLGDVIQFARYLPDVAALGARVILVVQDALCSLLTDFSGVSQCIAKSVAANGVPPFDFHCPLGSLPLAFATRLESIPAAVPYLPPPAEACIKAWEDRLGPHDKLRVGLVWSGNPEHKGDHHRSSSLRAYSAFLDVDATFISLQKDPRPQDRATLLERADVVDLTAQLTDFTETAALISCLDLVITVDTSVAHLAGALGCPTWILLPHTPDYRWLLDRDDSPWYPSVRLFRQPPSLDYAPVIDRVRAELLGLVTAHTLKLDPHDWGAARQSGIVFYQSGRLQEALAAFELCDRLRPNDCWAIYMRAGLLYELGRPEEALAYCNRSAERDSNYVPTLVLRGLCLHSLGRLEESLADNLRAHALDPADADVCNRIGDALQLRAQYDEALTWFDRALALRENFVEALLNKAFSLRHLRRFDESFASYDRVKAIDPGNVIADWNLANLHLLTGNFATGWALREVRWRMPMFTGHYPEFSQPMWHGDEAVEGKTILVQFDQGFGDTIQFARYLPMLAARGARVLLVVEDALHLILSGMPGVTACFPRSAANDLPPFDMHCPMMQLPLAFGTLLATIPAEIPYLPSPAPDRVQAWEDRLGSHERLRVGLVWSGSLGHKNDHNRSSSLRAFSAMLDVDATFVSLQRDPRPDDEALLRERRDIIDLTAHLTDFTETAALISCLDLVITVDTSVAHLAGALGRPTWILLPYLPDWRWLLDRDDSPWYPTARLFRQDASRDYAGAIDRMRAELLALAAGF